MKAKFKDATPGATLWIKDHGEWGSKRKPAEFIQFAKKLVAGKPNQQGSRMKSNSDMVFRTAFQAQID
ncbi:MAG: hypothetical protein ACYDC7_07260 [Acidithiobacillus ferrivorans]